MTQDEFAEYRYIIESALDFVKFGDKVNIVKVDGTIIVFSQRTVDVAVHIVARGPEFNVMYFDCGFKNDVDIVNLAAPHSIQALGELLRAHLKVKYGSSNRSADIGQ